MKNVGECMIKKIKYFHVHTVHFNISNFDRNFGVTNELTLIAFTGYNFDRFFEA